jgi:uncharacterized protein
MLNRLPVEVNPFRLVEQRKLLSGVLPLKHMERLKELTVADSDDLQVNLEFTRTPSGLPLVVGSVKGKLMLECQRCLQPIEYGVDQPIQVALTASQSDQRPEQEGFEAWLVEDERLFLQDFVEDEILLALPFAVKHPQCEPARALIEALPTDLAATTIGGQEDDAEVEPATKKNPFAVLKDWKKTES